MEDENNWYEARLDRIFAKGGLWKHRTFRTVLDPFSSEWNHTSMDKKIEILEKVVLIGEPLDVLITDYKMRYTEQNRRDISNCVNEALKILQRWILARSKESESGSEHDLLLQKLQQIIYNNESE